MVKAIENYLIVVSFENGEERVYNCYPLLEKKLYAELRDKAIFMKAYVDEMGLVCWDNYTDIEPHELYNNSIPISRFSI